MSSGRTKPGFTETHHALLFALLVKAIFEQADQQRGEEIVRRAVQRYGEQRGQRMARRALANGHPLSMANFFAYKEYRPVTGLFEREVIEQSPHYQERILICPWHAAWQTSGLLPYGRYYCQEIDEAVVRGFNPDLQVEVRGTLSNGAQGCEFVFHDAAAPQANTVDPAQTVQPWEYHCGHLFAALEAAAPEALGDAGASAVEAGLAAFAETFGKEAAQVVIEEARRFKH